MVVVTQAYLSPVKHKPTPRSWLAGVVDQAVMMGVVTLLAARVVAPLARMQVGTVMLMAKVVRKLPVVRAVLLRQLVVTLVRL
jgi:hypothetical protein